MCFVTYISSFILASAAVKFEEQKSWYLEKDFVSTYIIVVSCINGFGGAIIWVAQGRYISRIATDKNKGTFNSIFWAILMSCMILGALAGAFILD